MRSARTPEGALYDVAAAAHALAELVADMDVTRVPLDGVGALMGLVGDEIDRLAAEIETAKGGTTNAAQAA